VPGPMRDAVARLMKPRSIAIVGVSPEQGSPGGNVIGNLERVGFTGAVHLVSRTRNEVFGRPCLPTIDNLPDGVDVVVLCIPERAVVEAVEACTRKRAGNVVIFAAGFAETGGKGIAAQRRITEVARAAGMGVVGPNCLGLTNSLPGGVPLTFGSAEGRKVSGDQPTLGIVAQSGALAGIFRYSIQNRGLPVSYSVSSGNEAVLLCEDYLEHMLDDPAVRAVAIYAEQLRDPPRFLELARKARRLGKPIVMLHAGSTAIARESAITHTYSITGNYRAMRALTARAGVVIVDKIEELLDVAELFMYFPSPPTMGPAVMADSGAFKGHALDYAEKIGIDLPKLSPEIYQALVPVMPPYAPPSNPLDMTAQAIKEPEMYDKSLPILLSDPRVGSLILAPIMGSSGFGLTKGQRILDAVKGATKPVIMANLGFDGPISDTLIAECRSRGYPFFASPERALRAMAYLTHYARALARPETVVPSAGAARQISPHSGTLSGSAATDFVAAQGLPAAREPTADAGALPLVVKAERDPDWGPMVEVGFGGAWREVLPDTIVLPPDLDADSIASELGALAGARLFVGRDLGAAARAITRLGAIIRANPDLASIVLDPLLVDAQGAAVGGAVVTRA
jgi:acetate---CoA ligase (ADP-forming)